MILMMALLPLDCRFAMPKPDIRPHAYVLAVYDLARETAYFVDILGFSSDWSEDDNWQTVMRGGVRLMIGKCPDAIPVAQLGDHNYFGFFATDDVDALYAEFKDRGALIRTVPADKPWGLREMAVATPEGYRMMFAQSILVG